MEKVKVVKAIPGILNVGDILISPETGHDFCLEETDITTTGSNERYVSLDYNTVSENIPEFFEFVIELFEEDCDEVECCGKCNKGNNDPDFSRTSADVLARYEYFSDRFDASTPGSEAQIVYKNLMWFIEWLYGKAEVI
jgi:hypothetical protein